MPYLVTKTYGHDLGLSACFRQWRAKSHCRFFHGYPLSFKLTFGADTLDENNWVLDFGGLKPVKAWLCENFDHRLLVAEDDPALDLILELDKPRSVRRVDDTPRWDEVGKLADVNVVPGVGCESFANFVFLFVEEWLQLHHLDDVGDRGLRLVEVECREHGANSAIYRGVGE